MAGKTRIAIACLSLTFVISCGDAVNEKTATSSPASGPAAAVQSNEYKGVGVIKAINQKAPAIEIDHGDIEGLMPAMQMEFPVTDAKLLNGLAVNDQIDFTVENATDGMKVVAIKKK
ncbi:MAG TPA: copper-binding protein [Pyrinomonadaceae bacterium]|nr:copper-binding protein [Pyrinomonadaceae bacterium]